MNKASVPGATEKEFLTADLYYAAYLKVAGVLLNEARWEEGRVMFIFEGNPNLPDLRRDYYNRRGKVPALTLSDEIKAMKALTYETKRSMR